MDKKGKEFGQMFSKSEFLKMQNLDKYFEFGQKIRKVEDGQNSKELRQIKMSWIIVSESGEFAYKLRLSFTTKFLLSSPLQNLYILNLNEA